MIPWLVVVGALGAFLLLGWVLLVIWVWERLEHKLEHVPHQDTGPPREHDAPIPLE